MGVRMNLHVYASVCWSSLALTIKPAIDWWQFLVMYSYYLLWAEGAAFD